MNSFSEEDLKYIKGEKFSNYRKFNIQSTNKKNISRLKFLEEIVSDKNVIHLGFADHLPLIENKIKDNIWLHQLLINKAKFCFGIDSNKNAVETIRNTLNIDNIITLNIISDPIPESISSKKWDFMILGEILEHVDDPVYFLKKIKEKYANIVDKIIITVPNAFSVYNLWSIFKNKEIVNSDHRYWFTPVTLSKVVIRAKYRLEYFLLSQTFTPMNYMQRILVSKFPLTRETIILIANFK